MNNPSYLTASALVAGFMLLLAGCQSPGANDAPPATDTVWSDYSSPDVNDTGSVHQLPLVFKSALLELNDIALSIRDKASDGVYYEQHRIEQCLYSNGPTAVYTDSNYDWVVSSGDEINMVFGTCYGWRLTGALLYSATAILGDFTNDQIILYTDGFSKAYDNGGYAAYFQATGRYVVEQTATGTRISLETNYGVRGFEFNNESYALESLVFQQEADGSFSYTIRYSPGMWFVEAYAVTLTGNID